MAELTNREVVERFIEAMNVADFARAEQFLAPDFVEDYPQSGERIRGAANRRAVIENYPGRTDHEFVPGKRGALIGDDQWVLTPTMTLVRMQGSGERFTATGQINYPNGETWHLVQLIELRSGKIAKVTTYFAAPFEPAPYRAAYVERTPAPE